MQRNVRLAVGSLTILILILAAVGCDAIFGDGYEVRLRTDEEVYPAALDERIELTVLNRSDQVVYYLCAGEVSVERYDEDDLVDTFGFGNCECLCPNPIEAGRSETREYTIDDRLMEWIEGGPNSENILYRIRLKLYEDEAFEAELDLDDQRSNEFRIANP
jgi:hypothetical protein